MIGKSRWRDHDEQRVLQNILSELPTDEKERILAAACAKVAEEWVVEGIQNKNIEAPSQAEEVSYWGLINSSFLDSHIVSIKTSIKEFKDNIKDTNNKKPGEVKKLLDYHVRLIFILSSSPIFKEAINITVKEISDTINTDKSLFDEVKLTWRPEQFTFEEKTFLFLLINKTRIINMVYTAVKPIEEPINE